MSQSYQKLTNFFATVFILVTLYLPSSLCGQWISLDTASDSRGWKIDGDFIYIAKGDQLGQFLTQLPPKFSFKDVVDVRGVWIIFPKLAHTPDSLPNATASYTNTVKFSFAATAQLLDNVDIKYNAAGNSTLIKITSPNTHRSVTPRIMFDGWSQEEVSLGHSNRFEIEATTHEPGDFILIDRILATFVETTTTSRPRTSTTTTPLPKNEGCRPPQLAVFTGIITISCFLWNWNLL